MADLLLREEVLDKYYEVKVEFLASRNWECVPVIENMNSTEAELFCKAVKSIGSEKLVAYHCEFGEELQQKELLLDVKHIQDCNFEFADSYLLITDDKTQFLYYKDQNNEYYLLAGHTEFLCKSFPDYHINARKLYFDFVNRTNLTIKEKAYFERIWKKYAPLSG